MSYPLLFQMKPYEKNSHNKAHVAWVRFFISQTRVRLHWHARLCAQKQCCVSDEGARCHTHDKGLSQLLAARMRGGVVEHVSLAVISIASAHFLTPYALISACSAGRWNRGLLVLRRSLALRFVILRGRGMFCPAQNLGLGDRFVSRLHAAGVLGGSMRAQQTPNIRNIQEMSKFFQRRLLTSDVQLSMTNSVSSTLPQCTPQPGMSAVLLLLYRKKRGV